MRITNYVIRQLPTLYFILALVGYQLVASLLIPAPSPEELLGLQDYADYTAITQIYTIPYRVLTLLVMIGVLAFYRKRNKTIQPISLFTLYYALWLIRLLYDIYVRTDIPVALGPRSIAFAIIGFLSIFVTQRVYGRIDLERVFKILVVLHAVCIIGMLIRNPLFVLASSEIQGRTQGSIGLDPISTAVLAMSLMILIFYWLVNSGKTIKWYLKVSLCLLLLISLVIGLRASSRGPIVSFAFVMLFYFYCISKNKGVGIAIAIGLLIVILLFREQFLSLLGEISPVLQERFADKGETGLQREGMALEAIRGFVNHPLLGYAYGVMFQGEIGYPHNTILEAFNGLGLVGGLLFLLLIFYGVKESYYILHSKDNNSWICLLFMFRLVESMFSGNFYNDETLCVLWVFVFMYYHDRKKHLASNHAIECI